MAEELKINPQLQACNLPQNVATAFTEACGSILGTKYVPILYAGRQLVAGNNYILICKQALVLKESKDHVVKMVIYAPLPADKEHGAKATITSIETLL